MKKLTAALTLALTIALASVVIRPSSATSESCDCSAPDGSCSASASCTTGCVAVCPSDGCSAHCSGYYEFLQADVTLQMQNATNKQLVSELARVSGKEVAFSSIKSDVPFNLDVKRAPLWDVLELLSNNGTLLVAGEDFERLRTARRALLSGDRVSLCVHNTPVSTFVSDLANLSGLPIRITAGSTRATVNLKLQGVTLKDILTQASEETGAKITYEDPAVGAQ